MLVSVNSGQSVQWDSTMMTQTLWVLAIGSDFNEAALRQLALLLAFMHS